VSKIKVAVLGATGSVGQRLVALLAVHPFFELEAVAASERSVGKRYGDLTALPLPKRIAELRLESCETLFGSPFVFSALSSDAAKELERRHAEAGSCVISNARSWRQDPAVPLIIPEVNPHHLSLLEKQPFGTGKIVTGPNCVVAGLALALKPLEERFGLDAAHLVTLQAVSGAGFRARRELDIEDNILPYISEEEEKVESEPLKILAPAKFRISAQCLRVPVSDGHIQCLSFRLKNRASEEEVIAAWREFCGIPQEKKLPSAPLRPIHYFEEPTAPQPKQHRSLDKAMAVAVGRLRKCSNFDFKCVLLVHNMVRGAAGGAILTAELLLSGTPPAFVKQSRRDDYAAQKEKTAAQKKENPHC